ncbi:HAD family hydrolase [Pseudomonas monteilii]|uniref:HAD family hydrolase n=1 Tax=Pseudomonas monteilii TaxID=76759 RepID=UPI0037F71C32
MKHPPDTPLEALLQAADGLIFDCDGTLVDSLPAYANAWRAAFAESGKVMDTAWHATRGGLGEAQLMAHFEHTHQVTLDRTSVVATMRQHYLANLSRQLHEITQVTAIARRFAGVKPMAVASSGAREIVLRSLEALGLATLFDAIVTFDDVGKAKPDPAIHLHAARQLRLNPARCLVFEDSKQGLLAARRGGMPVVNVNVELL